MSGPVSGPTHPPASHRELSDRAAQATEVSHPTGSNGATAARTAVPAIGGTAGARRIETQIRWAKDRARDDRTGRPATGDTTWVHRDRDGTPLNQTAPLAQALA